MKLKVSLLAIVLAFTSANAFAGAPANNQCGVEVTNLLYREDHIKEVVKAQADYLSELEKELKFVQRVSVGLTSADAAGSVMLGLLLPTALTWANASNALKNVVILIAASTYMKASMNMLQPHLYTENEIPAVRFEQVLENTLRDLPKDLSSTNFSGLKDEFTQGRRLFQIARNNLQSTADVIFKEMLAQKDLWDKTMAGGWSDVRFLTARAAIAHAELQISKAESKYILNAIKRNYRVCGTGGMIVDS